MKIEIWSDVSCPFCYIGKRTLENAVSKLGLEVDMEFKSFELDPFVPKNFEGNVYKYLAKKYGRSHDEVMQMTTPVLQRGKELGLVFNFDIAKHTNTFDAHRLIHLAKQKGLQLQAKDALLSAYFEKGLHVGDTNTLIGIGMEIGLPEERIRQVLTSDEFSSEVRQDIQQARDMRVNGVPFFLVNGQYAIRGAQPEEVFIDTLRQIYQQTPAPSGNSDSLSCEIDKDC